MLHCRAKQRGKVPTALLGVAITKPGEEKKKHQKIASMVQSKADISDPSIFNDTLVTDQGLPFFKACNL